MSTIAQEPTAGPTDDTVEIALIDPWSSASGGVIERFLDSMWMRHGFSPPTLEAYRADLRSLDRWLLLMKQRTVVQAGEDDLREFLAVRMEGVAPRPKHPPSLSCIKRFYRFLVDGRFRNDDPTESVFVRAPRLVQQGDLRLSVV